MGRWTKVLLLLLFLATSLVMAVVLVLQLPVFGGAMEGERLARMQRSPQYVDGRFENACATMQVASSVNPDSRSRSSRWSPLA